MSQIKKRIVALRKAMAKVGVDAYLIPSSDPHQSEYVADHWNARTWISGFTGSAGIVVITAKNAYLWTDSRYFLQADTQLKGSGIDLQKQVVPHAPEHLDWLRDNLPGNAVIGLDGKNFSVGQLQALKKKVEVKAISVNTNQDLIAEIWTDRPDLPNTPIFDHKEKFAGVSRKDKIRAIQAKMEDYGATYHLMTTLDDIAWTFNIRGKDVAFNPVAIANAVIGKEVSYLFIDPQKVSDTLRKSFDKLAIVVKPYDALDQFLKDLPKGKILIDPDRINAHLHSLVDPEKLLYAPTIAMQLKAIKNETEIAHMKEVMVRDGVALTQFYRWLEKELKTRSVTECEVAEQLAYFRKAQGFYHGESFAAIVGYNGNGAIVHYRAMPDTCAAIEKSGMLLIDSGGQYEDGTTDITRTISLGRATKEQKKCYTLVLKGHIAIATLVFPRGTKGLQMDAFARQALWRNHLDYGHGTGHGVGFFLNVHEPPQGFTTTASRGGLTPIEEGMITSNEPGFYKTGQFGIRTENLMLTVNDETNEYGDFLRFETITLFPIDKKLIDLKLLSDLEIDWINQYHQEVEDQLLPHLSKEEQKWLEEKCREIG